MCWANYDVCAMNGASVGWIVLYVRSDARNSFSSSLIQLDKNLPGSTQKQMGLQIRASVSVIEHGKLLRWHVSALPLSVPAENTLFHCSCQNKPSLGNIRKTEV